LGAGPTAEHTERCDRHLQERVFAQGRQDCGGRRYIDAYHAQRAGRRILFGCEASKSLLGHERGEGDAVNIKFFVVRFSVNKMFYGTNPAKQLKNGLWCLFAGDANQDGGVYVDDYIRYRLTQGKKGYVDSDFNLDGGVYVEDYILYRINQGKRSGVPSNK
jgi:hypothetical protein